MIPEAGSDPWRMIDGAPSLPTEKPFNGDLVCVRLNDGLIIDARFEEDTADHPSGDLDWRTRGKWIRDDGKEVPPDNLPLMWCEKFDG